MQDQERQKVTLYLPPELHQRLKVKAAVEGESMSVLAERAIAFLLAHSDVVYEAEASAGQTHRVHNCPGCEQPVILKGGELMALIQSPSILEEEIELTPAKVGQDEELVPC